MTQTWYFGLWETQKSQFKKWTNRECCVQNNEDIYHQDVKIYFTTNQFTEFTFCAPHKKITWCLRIT